MCGREPQSQKKRKEGPEELHGTVIVQIPSDRHPGSVVMPFCAFDCSGEWSVGQ